MTILALDLDYEKFQKYGLGKREFGRVMTATLVEMAKRWHSEYLPRHFEESAYERYRYYRRKGANLFEGTKAWRESTVGRKRKRYGHNRPLVWTGASMIRALGPIRLRSVSSEQVRVSLPQSFNRRHSASRIRMRDEVTRIIPSERAELIEYGRKAFRRILQSPKQ